MVSPRRGRASSDATDGAPFRTGHRRHHRAVPGRRASGWCPHGADALRPMRPTARLSVPAGPGRTAVGGAVGRAGCCPQGPARGRAAGIRRRRRLGAAVAGSGCPTPVAGRGVRRWAAPSTACGRSAALGGAGRRGPASLPRAPGRPGQGEGPSPVECVPQRGGRVGRAGCRPQHLAPSACGQGWAGSGRGCAVPGPGEFRSDGRGGGRGTGVARRGTRRRERRAGGPLLSMPPPSARGSERSPAGRRARRRSRGGPCPCPRGRPGRS